jgi:hypothetical protein
MASMMEALRLPRGALLPVRITQQIVMNYSLTPPMQDYKAQNLNFRII